MLLCSVFIAEDLCSSFCLFFSFPLLPLLPQFNCIDLLPQPEY